MPLGKRQRLRLAGALGALLLATAAPAWLQRPTARAIRRGETDGRKWVEMSVRTWNWQDWGAWHWGKRNRLSGGEAGATATETLWLGPLAIEHLRQRRSWPLRIEQAAERIVLARETWGEQARFTFFPRLDHGWVVEVDRVDRDDTGVEAPTTQRGIRRLVLHENGSLARYEDRSRSEPTGKGNFLRD